MRCTGSAGTRTTSSTISVRSRSTTRARALEDLGELFFRDLDRGDSDDEVLKAVVHTVVAFDINPDCFRRFLRSMTMDLTVAEYETFDDLLDYMDGSAAVIGEMMLPILEPTSGEAIGHARDLGIAFQLTNFLARRRRGPRPSACVRAPGGSAPIRRRSVAAALDAGVAGAHDVRDRADARVLRVGRSRAADAATDIGAMHPRWRGCSTARSSIASRPPTATCSTHAPGSRPSRKAFVVGRGIIGR